jgi:serine/threonine-protein kinase
MLPGVARQTLKLKLKPNDVIGRYCVMRLIGEGGCGAVYHCRHLRRPEVEVAIKVLENANDEQRFKRERQVLAKLESAYVVKLIESGRHEGFPYLVLEFMDGGSLRDFMDARGRLPVKEAAWALVMALRGLRASKTVHRDLKPENLLLTRPAGKKEPSLVVNDIRRGSAVKVADFGLAKAFDPTMTKLTHTGQIMGTPLYMSPEQCRNTRDVTVHTDIYSLGVLFFEMVAGKPPFDADNAYDLMAKHCNEPPQFPRTLEPPVRAILERCLAKSPKDRYPTLIALERDLAKLAGVGEPQPDPGLSAAAWVVIGAAVLSCGAILWILREPLRQALGL